MPTTPYDGGECSLLSVEDAAAILKVPPSWIYQHLRRVSRERLPGFKLGKYWRIRQSELMRWVEEQRVGAKPKA